MVVGFVVVGLVVGIFEVVAFVVVGFMVAAFVVVTALDVVMFCVLEVSGLGDCVKPQAAKTLHSSNAVTGSQIHFMKITPFAVRFRSYYSTCLLEKQWDFDEKNKRPKQTPKERTLGWIGVNSCCKRDKRVV